MQYRISIPHDGWNFVFDLLSSGDFESIVVDGVVVFQIAKRHNHRYEFDAFFYASKRIYTGYCFKSKKELFGAIQLLLQKELHGDVQ